MKRNGKEGEIGRGTRCKADNTCLDSEDWSARRRIKWNQRIDRMNEDRVGRDIKAT